MCGSHLKVSWFRDVLSFSLWTQMMSPSAAANHSPQKVASVDSTVKHTTAGGSLPLGEVTLRVTRGTTGLTSHTLLHPTRLHELTLSLPIGRGIAV